MSQHPQPNPTTPAIALTVAGSDCSTGAGLQADLKTFEAMGVYGVTIASVLTAQNSTSILALLEVPADFIGQQFEAIFADLKVGALKTGLLTSPAMIECVADNIAVHAADLPLVIDPVISASSGRIFLNDEALETCKTLLLPKARLITPNLHEAGQLLGHPPAENETDMNAHAVEISETFGGCAVLIKGGHLEGMSKAVDILYDGRDFAKFSAPFIQTANNRGTGCTLSAAITAELAKGSPLNDAVRAAKSYVTKALQGAVHFNIGVGAGPLNHVATDATGKDVN